MHVNEREKVDEGEKENGSDLYERVRCLFGDLLVGNNVCNHIGFTL